MASFESFLQLKGRQYRIQYSDSGLHQYVDALGRPSQPTLGGAYQIEIDVPARGE